MLCSTIKVEELKILRSIRVEERRMPDFLDEFESIPVGSLGIISMHGCEELGKHIDEYLVKWRAERQNEHKNTIAFVYINRFIFLYILHI